MGVASTLQKGFDNLIDKAGRPIRLIYYNENFDSTYDDSLVLTHSGNTFTSGIILPLNSTIGTNDSLLVEQGKLQNDDNKLYLSGNIALTGSETQVRIQLGSNSGESYSVINPGPLAPEVESQIVYKKVFIRRLTTGSLIGE